MNLDVGLLTALGAGALSFFSPCVLPIVPGYLSFITGFSFDDLTQERQKRVVWVALINSLAFVAGFSLVFISLGAAATAVGGFLRSHLKLLGQIAGVLIIVLGLHLTGIFRLSFLLYDKRVHSQEKARGLFGAFAAGIFFGFGWTPCVGPVLAGILGLAAFSNTVTRGIVLLAFYSAGLGFGFIMAALFLNQFLLASKKIRMHLHKVEVASGVLLILIGGLILTNQLARISSRLAFLNPEVLATRTFGTAGPVAPGPKVTLRQATFDPGEKEFQAQTLAGEARKLSDYSGKLVMVNFWATWCGPCKQEIPGLLSIYQEKKQHFEILGIAEDSNVDDIHSFVKEMAIDYPILIDGNGSIGEQYQLMAYPSSYLFAPDGELLRTYPGYLDEKILRKDLAEFERKYSE